MPKVAKANCGIPAYDKGKIIYSGTAALMAVYARMARDCGARIVGGCCGTTPAHVAAMAAALEGSEMGYPPEIEQIEQHLGPMTDGAKAFAKGGVSLAKRITRGRLRRRTSA